MCPSRARASTKEIASLCSLTSAILNAITRVKDLRGRIARYESELQKLSGLALCALQSPSPLMRVFALDVLVSVTVAQKYMLGMRGGAALGSIQAQEERIARALQLLPPLVTCHDHPLITPHLFATIASCPIPCVRDALSKLDVSVFVPFLLRGKGWLHTRSSLCAFALFNALNLWSVSRMRARDRRRLSKMFAQRSIVDSIRTMHTPLLSSAMDEVEAACGGIADSAASGMIGSGGVAVDDALELLLSECDESYEMEWHVGE
eukprot:TRINITY_DN6479_c0_g2_i1.p1 TRINITY_DN6479_c0_g2~~TRINITY_DN6479_c0_g2_i1.p1  ORF type:complete len:306 (+),score=63.16 TRINITY_DN6479_c0_g2_i1:131-919(+)